LWNTILRGLARWWRVLLSFRPRHFAALLRRRILLRRGGMLLLWRRMLLSFLASALLRRRVFGRPLLVLRLLVILRGHPYCEAGQHHAKNNVSGNRSRRIHEICSLANPRMHLADQSDHRSTP
jgi:hypothetical protein